ncbi:hypothetical protein CANCADRAFT_3122 [Tortispora caseinolytica NRRL Y-17796]|uniref:Golgi apparatus membrane protein TVP15 n=1 Tax=Tortispora caseinolytica NRRL Y-17796 TaxID=767744 RepID=A0A1E4TIC1_9ASCO|nr:hypothetical protein CANCADRAFT_3122 [Tortispora caseinolytica NRRL Y-17796]
MDFIAQLDPELVFKSVNLTSAILMILGGVSQFFPVSFQSTVIAVYVIIFGLVIGLLEFQIPPAAPVYASFLFSFIGRGVFYIFVGSILLHSHVLRILAGSVIIAIGIAYVALEFMPSVDLPHNMRVNDYQQQNDTI